MVDWSHQFAHYFLVFLIQSFEHHHPPLSIQQKSWPITLQIHWTNINESKSITWNNTTLKNFSTVMSPFPTSAACPTCWEPLTYSMWTCVFFYACCVIVSIWIMGFCTACVLRGPLGWVHTPKIWPVRLRSCSPTLSLFSFTHSGTRIQNVHRVPSTSIASIFLKNKHSSLCHCVSW